MFLHPTHHHHKPRVLFILKRRHDYHHQHYCNSDTISTSTGLYNSANFVHEMLANNGVDSKVVVVVDNNDIDREVTLYRPTHVIIEALWVVPEKFEILSKLHPKVKWIIRFHSEVPFIASEGMAMKWLFGYMKNPNIILGINAYRFLEDVRNILKIAGFSGEQIHKRVRYLPNYYPVDNYHVCEKCLYDKRHVDIGCFGAIRPMKNQLQQAIAALEFADSIGKKLHFHVNVGRIETKGDPVLHNLEALFEPLEKHGHKLVVNMWQDHKHFLRLVRSMDIGMQVSFSETFNIVAADFITSGIPIVVSDEVPWVKIGIADPTNSDDIVKALKNAWRFKCVNVFLNAWGLNQYSSQAKEEWLDFFV